MNSREIELIGKIQPQGGISFADPRFVRKGDGYEACIHVYRYPKEVHTSWLTVLTSIQDAIVTIDIGTQNVNEAKKNINRSMGEQRSRYAGGKSDAELLDAQELYSQLNTMYRELNAMGEVMKLIHARIYVYAQSEDELDKNIKGVINRLDGYGYKSAVFLGETREEWDSLYKSYSEQSEKSGSRRGQPVLSETLAGGYPFHFTSLSDPYGFYFGRTTTGGSVLFDPFHSNKSRTSFNGLIAGKSGAGKSTFLKKLMLDRAIRGDFIRGIDVKGDFSELIRYLGGKIITLDGSQGIINPFEIFKTNERESVSFVNHISKLNKFYRFLVPAADTYEITEFENTAQILYEQWGLSPTHDAPDKRITGLAPQSYPVIVDFLTVLKKELYEDEKNKVYRRTLSPDRQRRLNNIELVITNLIKSYGNMFNGYTTIPRLTDEQIVFFNAQTLSGMKDEIFDVQLFSCLSLIWDNMITTGGRMKRLYDARKIIPEDITHYMVIIDEAHRIVNTEKIYTVDYLSLFQREARAYFAGLWFASQGIRDFVPEGSDSTDAGKIKTLFEMTQYKVLFRQDDNSKGALREIFSGQLTEDELKKLSRFDRGQCELVISGDRNIEFSVKLTEREDKLYQGGI